MKYLPRLFLAAVAVFSLSSYAALNGRGETQKQLGPHSAEKFALATILGGPHANPIDDLAHPRTICIVLTVNQTMKGKGQEIVASASTHRDGPTGSLIGMDGLHVHVTQPADFGTKPQKTGEARITNTVPAPGGKFRTVVAEASMSSSQYSNAVVNLTIPGDK